MVAHILGSTKYETSFATSGTKALAPFADLPVIMLTGQSEKEVVHESLRAGAADFIVKPFAKELLLKKVSKYLHRA